MKYNKYEDKDIDAKILTKKTMILFEYLSNGNDLKEVLPVVNNFISLCNVVSTSQRFDEFCRNVDESVISDDSILNLCLYLRRNCYTHDTIKIILEQWKNEINEIKYRSELL